MRNKTFLDTTLPLIQRHLEELWSSCEKPRALYVRGSILSPIELLAHTPWDLDFVLFVSENVDAAKRKAIAIMSQIRENEPTLPPPDISVVSDNYCLPESLYALLIVSRGGRLLLGKDCRAPESLFAENHAPIFQHALKRCTGRLALFAQCNDAEEQQKRAPHLAKSVLRLGGLLGIREGFFTRQPEECAILLTNANPQLGNNVELLLATLQTPVDQEVLAEACGHLLYSINKMVSGR